MKVLNALTAIAALFRQRYCAQRFDLFLNRKVEEAVKYRCIRVENMSSAVDFRHGQRYPYQKIAGFYGIPRSISYDF